MQDKMVIARNGDAMIDLAIPGFKRLTLESLVLDYNGTIAVDGAVISGVGEILEQLARRIHIHILTADTFGSVAKALLGILCHLSILPLENQDTGKLDYIEKLGKETVVCIGNGRNDRLMLKEAALGIAVIQKEGAATETVMAVDVITSDILDALDLLVHPLRLVATLRS